MSKQNKKHNKKLKRLLIICLLCAIILTVSTYAWFIGMRTVNVSSFDVDIATTEGLFLSMDGQNWSYQLDARNATPYAKNTNVWADEEGNKGLIPMSSVGDMDPASSTMKLYEKASLTATKGGYRLLASRIHNFDNKDTNNNYVEGKGYVAFDLFIKNLSGTEYYADNQPLNEEAIYLTTNSAVIVAQDGEQNTGIENSVRVAFTQIGRIKADSEVIDDITSMTCAGDTDKKVTGICRNAQIWEPNDTAHVANAISWYETSCLTRKSGTDGATISNASAYNTTGDNTACGKVKNGTANNTFAVTRAIGVDDNVDVYDGADFNTYAANVSDYATYSAAIEGKTGSELDTVKNGFKLVNYPYFTDTMKNLTGMQRPTFMTLAPNSITKVRVYIYIEGQDIDNYDFASLGKKISVNFGFTKERFTETDVNYDSANSPSTNITNINETHTQTNNSANNG